jgi:uncharacterized protein (TIGR02452 family)
MSSFGELVYLIVNGKKMDVYYDRIEIYKATQELALAKYPDEAETFVHDQLRPPPEPLMGYRDKVEVEVRNADTLDTLLDLHQRRYNPVLLNMADPSIPGGCVNMGASAQEENIFRRTNYFMTLKQLYYPLLGLKTLYSRNVVYFRAGEETGYRLIHPLRVCIIAAASVRHPWVDQSGEHFKNTQEFCLQKDKIRMIFQTAFEYHHDAMVLSAFGCGSFKCPAKEVAEMFREVIVEYQTHFKYIIFAIKQPVDDLKKANFEIFRSVLQQR